MNCDEPTTNEAEEAKALAARLSKIGHIFVVVSGKGGVGKSTVAVNLALSLALRGMRTGILDVDIHGPSVPKLLGLSGHRAGVANEEVIPIDLYGNLKVMSMAFFLDGNQTPVIWRGPVKAKMIRELVQNVAWGDLDCLVVDCPPGTGDEPLSVAQLLAGKSSAIIVTTPQEVSTIDVEKCITFCEQLAIPVAGIIENMSGFVCPHCGKEVDIFSSGGGERLADKFVLPFLGKIPLDPDIVKSGDEEKPYVYFYSKTATAKKFEEVLEKIISYGLADKPRSSGEASAAPATNTECVKESTMKFAVPTSDGRLCAHFGHCEKFAIIDANEQGAIVNETYITPPPHEPGLLPPWLAQQGVNYIIAGGMGSRAQQLFTQQGVKVVTGAQGEFPREIVENYLKGTLATGANTCDH